MAFLSYKAFSFFFCLRTNYLLTVNVLKIWYFKISFFFNHRIQTRERGGVLSKFVRLLIHPLIKKFSEPLPSLSIPNPGPYVSVTPDRHLHVRNGQRPPEPWCHRQTRANTDWQLTFHFNIDWLKTKLLSEIKVLGFFYKTVLTWCVNDAVKHL